MEIIVGKKAGFCFGVKNAVDNSIKEIKNSKKIYCLGELVHNEQVISKLTSLGMMFVENIEDVPSGEKVIFRAHGIKKEIYEEAKARNIEIIDLTCPIVLSIHKKIEEYSKDSYIILIGEKKHAEIIASKSFAKDIDVVENEDDITNAITNIKSSKYNKVFILSQTTFSMSKFDDLSQKIENLLTEIEVIVDKTICNATELRQNETEELSKQVELMIIIGGKKSANTKKLYDISMKNCKNTILIQTKDDIDIKNIKRFNKIGIMAGASTPENVIHEVIQYIHEI